MGAINKDGALFSPETEKKLSGIWNFTVDDMNIVIENIPPEDLLDFCAAAYAFNLLSAKPSETEANETVARSKEELKNDFLPLTSQKELEITYTVGATKMLICYTERGHHLPLSQRYDEISTKFVLLRVNSFDQEDFRPFTLTPFLGAIEWLQKYNPKLVIKNISPED